MAKLSIDQVDLKGKRVILRVDFNVPQDKKTGAITNPQHIAAAEDQLRRGRQTHPPQDMTEQRSHRCRAEMRKPLRMIPYRQRNGQHRRIVQQDATNRDCRSGIDDQHAQLRRQSARLQSPIQQGI